MIKVNVQSVERVEGPILTIDDGEKLPTTYKYLTAKRSKGYISETQPSKN